MPDILQQNGLEKIRLSVDVHCKRVYSVPRSYVEDWFIHIFIVFL